MQTVCTFLGMKSKSNFTFLCMEMSVGEPKLKPCINLQ